MSLRPKHGALDIRSGFTFESTVFKYKLEESIGDGGYGRVFEAEAALKGKKQGTQKCAVKLERRSGATDIEVRVFEAAKDKNCRYIPRMIDHGFIQCKSCSFIAMELKGRDLHKIRKDRQGSKFTLGTAVRVALSTLEAIKELHELGFLSRDIKGGNFVTGQTTTDDIRNIYLIDFGLCRRYKDMNDNVIAERSEVGWRGTTRYGSRSAHQHLDLGRKDDIESWFYMIVEMTNGSLPWSAESDRNAVYKLKQEALSNVDDFLKNCPHGYKELIGAINKLNFADTPDYKNMSKVLEKILAEQGVDRKSPMDWETVEEPERQGPADVLDSFPTTTTQRRV